MRLSLAAVACLALAVAAVFLARSERHLTDRHEAMKAFGLHAREAVDALAEVRAAQQAYVAAGQGTGFWIPKVASTTNEVASTIASLGQAAKSGEAKAELGEAAAALTEFGVVDARARSYVKSRQELMAADVIFTEGSNALAGVARHVEAAAVAEGQEADAAAAATRRIEAMTLAGAGLLIVLTLLALVPARNTTATIHPAPAAQSEDLVLQQTAPVPPPKTDGDIRHQTPVLTTAAALCTDFGRVRDASDLTQLLRRAARLMEASGLIMWLGNETGEDLRAVVSHGYGPQALANMPTVPRTASNAAAAAYRTGELQIVPTRPGVAPGAIVAPILTVGGCVGALSVEVRGGSETSDTVQALAAIFASQLAGVLAPSTAAAATDDGRAAASG